MKKISILILVVMNLSFALALIDDPKLPKIQSQSTTTISSGGSGGNVTSVSSGDGCIFVSPTTGDVVLTFNTSCGSGSSFLTNQINNNLNRSANVTFSSVNITNYLDFADLANSPSNPPSLIQRLYAFLFHGISQIKFVDNTGFETTLGRDNYLVVRNIEGFTINKGQLVYINGRNGNVPTIGLAKADSELTTPAIGVVAETINNNAFGRVIIYGKLSNLDTSTLTEGNSIYVSDTQAGNFTETPPTAPNLRQRIGIVLVSGVGNGAIEVDTQGVTFGKINNQNIPFSDGTRLTQDNNLTWNSTNRILNASYLAGDGHRITNVTVKNPFNQDLNTTNNVQFNNVSAKNVSASDTFLGRDIILNQAGTAIFPDTSFTINPVSLGSGLVSVAMMVFSGGAGLTVGAIQDGLYILPALATTSSRILLSRNQDATDAVVLEVNNATGDLWLIRQNPFAPSYNTGRLNATNWNITSEHQSYDITGATALDTTYTNTQRRVIYIDVTFQSSRQTTGDIAYIDGYEDGNLFSQEGTEFSSKTDSGDPDLELHHMGIYVQPNGKWSLNSTVGGNGAVTLNQVEVTVI